MTATLSGIATGRLERSCDSIRIGQGARGIERVEAWFTGAAFDAHRHDTYAIGRTVSGVQTFRYRGAQRTSLPGQILILHPDELHDGGPGTDDGLGYRMIYIDPALIQDALGGRPLPFVANPIVTGRTSACFWLRP